VFRAADRLNALPHVPFVKFKNAYTASKILEAGSK